MSFIRKIKQGNRIYLAEVENQRIAGKIVQKHIRYVGREADGETVLASSLSHVEVDSVKLYGPLLVLHHLAEEIGLRSYFGDYGNEIISLVYAHCLDYKSINQMDRWFERSDLQMLLKLDNLTEKRLLKSLDFLGDINHTGHLQKKIFDAVKSKYPVEDKGIIYDVTNTYFYGKKCILGKYGKDKEGVKGRPLIQIGLATTQQEGIPIFHKVYDGNIHDARILQDMITTFQTYGIHDGLIVFDRGITSGQNQKDIQGLKWKVLCGLPIKGTLQKYLEDAASKEDILKYENRVRLNKTIFYVFTKEYTLDGITGTLAICFNERQSRELKESRYDEISEAENLLKKGKSIKPEMKEFFDKQGKLVRLRLKKAELLDGYSCIFTTADISKDMIVKMYFDKDVVEKAFQSIKGITRVQPIRHWLYNRVIAHVFICYLSYLLLTLLKIRLKPLGVSPVEALTDLDSLYKVYLRDKVKGFQLSRTVALTKYQENILKTIDKNLLTKCSV